MSKKQYWQSLDELEQTPAYKEAASKEFQDELPVVDFAQDLTKVGNTGRRDFLKMLGFSVSAAAIATSCKIPVKQAIPYTFDTGNGPFYHLVPGIAEYFASSYIDEAGVQNVLVKTREGRPIKIEPNLKGNINTSGSTVRAQASVLGLYDNTRMVKKDFDWSATDKEITGKLDAIAAKGGKVVLLSNTLASPMYAAAIAKLQVKYPNVEHVIYDPVSLNAIRQANEVTLGQAIIPSYRFDKADVIVGVSADFLGTWLSPVEFSNQYGVNRVPSKKNGYHMSRHYQYQSNATITGASADYKTPIKPSQEKQLLLNLYNAITGNGLGSVAAIEGIDITQTVQDLLNAKGKALVVCGTNDVECQLITNAINIALGSYGTTIDTANPSNLKAGDDAAFLSFVKNLSNVDGLILLGANPAYNTPFNAEFAAALANMDLTVALADRADETAKLAQHILPGRHYLESWNVLEPKKGQYTFVQPTIQPLFPNGTRPYVESLLAWAGAPQEEYDFVHNFAKANIVGGEQGWIAALKSGSAGAPQTNNVLSADLGSTLAKVSTSLPSASGIEVVFYESVGVGDGTHANNPFVQEFPDPISRLTWDNYLAISYDQAEQWNLDRPKKMWTNNNNKTVDTATLTVNGKSVTLPILIQFGLPANTVAIALGYGRPDAGRAADGVGQDVYPFLTQENGNFKYSLDGASIEINRGANFPLGLVQVYGTLMEEYALPGKTPKYRSAIVKDTNLKSYKKNHHAGNEDRANVLHHKVSLYPQHDFPGHHWGMAIDMNACFGCGACVVSCNIENNVPIVGKTEVFRGHDMHWIRIDRYYSGDRNNPDVSFQPMMCQHCDNAPCENVCPVNATNHSAEGLNQMAYNRCIGTRYCANNCPYKVRRFNWLDYQAADMFGKFNDNKKGWGNKSTLKDGGTEYMYEDLTRMVLNPDVTVRSRGVIEKCSFCVQRVQEAKLTAKKENRSLKDGDIKVACQTACSADAIAFGDLNDKNSTVHKLFYNEDGTDRMDRNYHVLEEQHFLPSVGYQVKIRNVEEDVARDFA